MPIKHTPRKDLTGKIIGELTVIKLARSENYNRIWLCDCSCGKSVEKSSDQLSAKNTAKHCGCKSKKRCLEIGQTFGKLTITGEAKIQYRHRNDLVRAWECLCECGNSTKVSTYDLISGNTTSCGCKRNIYGIDLTGKRFERLLVIDADTTSTKQYNKHWTCICDCGKTISVATSALVRGKTKSCGCFFEDRYNDYRISKGNLPTEPLTVKKNLLRGRLSGKKKHILQQYSNKCQLCQEEYTSQSLEVHHIVPMSVNDELYKQKENLIPLCKKCHRIAHNNNWQQIDLFIQKKLAAITGLILE